MNYLPRGDRASELRASEQLDYKSIMIYSSYMGRAPNTQRWPLLTAQGECIWNGGNENPELAGPSPTDIERVKKLYLKGSGAPRQAHGGRSEKRVSKRWHTIPFESEAGPGHARAWPAWVCDSTTYIFYCFEDQASHDALNDLFLSGLAKWAQAFRRSSVVFAADTACGAYYLVPCLCSTPGVKETTLHIIQGKRGEMWPFSTLGYTKPSIDKVYPTLPRHFIQWPTNAGVFNARGPLFMAQQIGEAPR